jgi:Protein of unknown function (DUF3617)
MNDWMLLFLRWSPPSVQIVRKPKRRPHIRSFFSLLILFNTTAMAQSAAPPQVPQLLDVKPGLWEFVKVVTVLMHQTIPPEMFANFPKEQRDKIIDDIRAKENAAHPNTQKGNLCMPKQEQALTGLMVVPASDCAKTVTSSGNGSQTHIICPAKAPANALAANAAATATVVQDSHFERIDAENFKGTITANQSAPSLKMNATVTFTAHFIRDTCGPAPLPPGQAVPISVSTTRIGNRYEIHIQNQTDKPVTAYAFQMGALGGGGSTRFVDTRIEGGQPMKPHGGAAQYFPEGMPVASGAVTAGVFADGAAFGEPKTLAELMARRTTRVRALKAIGAILCAAERSGQDPSAVAKTLQTQPPYQDPSNVAMLSNIYAGTFAGVAERMKKGSGGQPMPIPQAMQLVTSQAETLAMDPVKDPSGHLYIAPEAMPSACKP